MKITDGFLWKADWVESRKLEYLLFFLLSLIMPSLKSYVISGGLLKKHFFFSLEKYSMVLVMVFFFGLIFKLEAGSLS